MGRSGNIVEAHQEESNYTQSGHSCVPSVCLQNTGHAGSNSKETEAASVDHQRGRESRTNQLQVKLAAVPITSL